MQISIDIKNTTGQIVELILKEFKSAVNGACQKAIPNIQSRVGGLVKDLVAATPEFDSLLRGTLRSEFGLQSPQSVLIQILDKLSQSVKVHFIPTRVVNEELDGSIIIELVKDDFTDILRLPETSYYSREHKIDWLDWLLFKGDSIIIADYAIRYFNRPIKGTRTNALMFQNKKNLGWQVPAQFSGTADDNFITRAFSKSPVAEKLIEKILEEEITSRII